MEKVGEEKMNYIFKDNFIKKQERKKLKIENRKNWWSEDGSKFS